MPSSGGGLEAGSGWQLARRCAAAGSGGGLQAGEATRTPTKKTLSGQPPNGVALSSSQQCGVISGSESAVLALREGLLPLWWWRSGLLPGALVVGVWARDWVGFAVGVERVCDDVGELEDGVVVCDGACFELGLEVADALLCGHVRVGDVHEVSPHGILEPEAGFGTLTRRVLPPLWC